MNRYYGDILSLTDAKPQWFDENAVPRYCAFSPSEVDIYADDCCLMLIECQSCGHDFKVAMAHGAFENTKRPLSRLIETNEIHYGDPPNVGCCSSGPTMNSVPRRILEFWTFGGEGMMREWVRVPKFEVPIQAEWENEP